MNTLSATTEIYWAALVHPLFRNKPLYIAATDRGLCRITWPTESLDTLKSWAARQIPGAVLIEDEERMAGYLLQLKEYLEGTRQQFDVPLDMRGTAFQTSVWKALAEIPFGETRSYSDIAA
ncbi:MGMT family protein, partial [Paenibacillus sp. HGF7]|uniref:methylated-DNA--[protein]-cysteine S-methyltransferase n=2 Tax=Paenibacillus TaxID=44249 RepID=UPI00020D78F3